MTGSHDKRGRSRNMAAIRSTGTLPEMRVRSLLHRLGYRFRLHAKELPGKPDLVFRSRRKVILVHGCFWHQHPAPECADGRAPKSNLGYWAAKLARNVNRDQITLDCLRALGFGVLVLWECETRDEAALAAALRQFLGQPGLPK